MLLILSIGGEDFVLFYMYNNSTKPKHDWDYLY